MFILAKKKVLPSLVTLELVGSSQDVAESPTWLEVQKTFHLQTQNSLKCLSGTKSRVGVWITDKRHILAAWSAEGCWHVDRTPPPGTGAAGPPGWTETCWWGARPGCTERTSTQIWISAEPQRGQITADCSVRTTQIRNWKEHFLFLIRLSDVM